MYHIELLAPTGELESSAMDFKQEHFNHGQLVINGSALLDKSESYDAWLKQIENNSDERTVQPDWVVSSTFFAVRKDDNKLIGMIDIRHRLNQFLSEYAGHIGYSVRPSERNKGYATEMLRLGLEYCKKIGLQKVMLGCYKDNIASIKTITKCGGVLEKERLYTDGKPMLIYWIYL